MMKKKKILSSGEFARLCKTTKATLFHYDQAKLLSPKYVSENGYRYYGVEQYLDFDMIAMLKETGGSLKEIKACLDNPDGGDFLSLLKSRLLVVKKERKKLALREQMIRDMIECTRESLNFPYDNFMLQKQSEERLETCPTDSVAPGTMEGFIASLIECADFYEEQEKVPRYPYGVILNREALKEGRYMERCYFGRATRTTPQAQLHIKAAGTYAVLAHKGSWQTHQDVFEELLRQVQGAGLKVTGNAYVYDMMSYFLEGAGAIYASKYCIEVR